jgi:hypothetical protein
LKDAIKLLDALKVQYAILDLEGNQHGSLEIKRIKRVPIKSRRSPRNYEFGALANYLRPYITALQIGDMAVIPSGPFALPHIARSSSSMAHHLWGKGNSKHTLVREKNSVELMRIG